MKKKRRSGFIIACTAPAIILFIIFMIIPTIDVFRMSLYKWGGYTAEKTFVGFENFKKLSQNPKFYQAFQNSILLIVIVTLVTFCFSLVFASKNQGTEFFPYRVLYTEYSLRCSHQCDLFRNLRPEPGTFKQFLKFVPGRRGSHSLAGQPEAGNLQRGHCHGMAGRRILYGNVYGKYGECAGEPL